MNFAASQHNSEISDKDLALDAKNGNANAFSVLSERYMPFLKGRANRYSNVVGVDTDDFVQEGMLALFRAVKGFDASLGIQFNTYAVTCINNSMATAIKSHMKDVRVSSSVPIDDVDEEELKSPLQHSQDLLEDLYIRKEDTAHFADQIQSLLSNFEQQVLKLYLRGNSYHEISGLLSTSTKAVDNALQRVRRKLRPNPYE